MRFSEYKRIHYGFYECLWIQLTLKCPLQCEHCCVNSAPFRQECLSYEDVQLSIHDFSRLDSSRLICFTGGEPFLPINQLHKHLDLCQKLGLSSYVISSAYWANTYKDAIEVLTKNFPISLLCISADRFHEPFVSLMNILNACRAAINLEIDVALTVTVEKNQDDPFLVRILEQLGNLVEEVDIYTTLLGAVGRSNESARNDQEVLRCGACPSLGTPVITADGSICACCQVEETNEISQKGNSSHALRLGSIRDNAIWDARERINGDILLRAIRALGPEWIAKKVSSKDHTFLYQLDNAKTMCEICSLFTRNPEIANQTRKILNTPASLISIKFAEELSEERIVYNHSPNSALYPAKKLIAQKHR